MDISSFMAGVAVTSLLWLSVALLAPDSGSDGASSAGHASRVPAFMAGLSLGAAAIVILAMLLREPDSSGSYPNMTPAEDRRDVIRCPVTPVPAPSSGASVSQGTVVTGRRRRLGPVTEQKWRRKYVEHWPGW
jgi:hypothetical protein